MSRTARFEVTVLFLPAVLAGELFARQPPEGERPPPPIVIKDALDVPMKPGDGRKVVTLAHGATLEVVGVSPHPSGPNSWWTHDGAPMAEAPCDPSRDVMTSDKGGVFRAILVRVKGVPDGADASWGVAPPFGTNSSGPATRGGKPVSGLILLISDFPKDARTCSIAFEVADAPWKTVTATNGQGARGQASAKGPNFVLGEAVATADGGTTITVTHDIQGQSVRVAGVDLDRTEHVAVGGGDVGVSTFHQLGAVFDLPPAAFREYRLQTRPYERAEFKGVALNPDKRD